MLDSILQTPKHFFLTFSYLNWRDFVEIFFLATVIYYFSLWLKKDKQKNLIYPFFSYCALLLLSHYLHLQTVSTILFISIPIVILIFITIHQETLQKNFILLRKFKYPNSAISDWPEELIKISLNALNKNKEIIFVIEKHDSLDTIINSPFKFHADLQKDILDILIDKHICSPNYFIWLTHEGKLTAINGTWNFNLDQNWINSDLQLMHKWKQDGIFVTSKTDALIFRINPTTRTFDIVIQGKLLESIAPQDMLIILKRNLNITKETKTKDSKVVNVLNNTKETILHKN